MVNLFNSLSQISQFRVLLIGDYIVDRYTLGEVTRISPEAPVPVLKVKNTHILPGGAGNVILNLVSLGGKVIALGRLGKDPYSRQIKELLKQEQVDVRGLVEQVDYTIPVKNRVIANHQQLVRIDEEEVVPLSEITQKELLKIFEESIAEVDIVAISDYGKGAITRSFFESLCAIAYRYNKPVIVDPKSIDMTLYRGATLIKPNLSEAIAAAKLDRFASLCDIAQVILEDSGAQYVIITKSKEGISVFEKDKPPLDFAAKVKEVKDVTGAGDTVLAVITCALACGLSIAESAHLANVAAGIVIEQLGCARIYLSDLADRLLHVDHGNKIFNQNHAFVLNEALKHRDVIVICFNSLTALNGAIFHQICNIKKAFEGHRIVAYLNETEVEQSMIQLISSLDEIDFLMVSQESYFSWYPKLAPNQAYFLENNVLMSVDNVPYQLE